MNNTSDLEINIALAEAMGWTDDDISASFISDILETYDWNRNGWRRFDYCDPVIFVAICKRWGLEINFLTNVIYLKDESHWYGKTDVCIERAAAFAVIDAVKRGAI